MKYNLDAKNIHALSDWLLYVAQYGDGGDYILELQETGLGTKITLQAPNVPCDDKIDISNYGASQ